MFVCGLYGRPRDELIARSKIIVNINSFEKFRIFEIVRVSYLLANGKAVVANVQPDRYVEPDIAQAVAMVALDDVPQTCIDLLADDVRRVAMESKGISTMHQRSIVPILQDALRQSGIGVSR